MIGYCYYKGDFSAQYRIRAIEHMNGVIRLMTEHYPLSREFRETKEFREITEGLDGKF